MPWVTVTVFPATLKLPVLEAPVLLVITEKVTAPLPFPVTGGVIWIQLSLLTAAQGQVVFVITETVPSAEKFPKASEVGFTK